MISIIIPVRDRIELLSHCVKKAKELAKGTHEIIVVDDGSKVPLRLEDKDIKLIVNPVSLGPGAARNLGTKHCEGGYSFLH